MVTLSPDHRRFEEPALPNKAPTIAYLGTRKIVHDMASLSPKDIQKDIATISGSITTLHEQVREKRVILDSSDVADLEILAGKLKQVSNQNGQTIIAIEEIRKIATDRDKKETLLHTHVLSHKHNLLEKDLQTISPDAVNARGFTALHEACWTNDIATAKILLKAGANVDFGHESALSFAIRGNSDKAMIQLLLDAGADPNLPDKEGRTPLMFAAEKGKRFIVDLLLDNGAKVDQRDKKGQTALWHAALNGKSKTCQALLAAGADPGAIDVHERPLIYFITSSKTTHWKEISTVLKSKAPEKTREFASVFKRTKLVTHAFEIGGSGAVFDKTISFESGQRELAASTMAKSCKHFAHGSQDFEELSSLLEQAADRKHTPSETVNQIKKGEPVAILTGYQGHAVTVLIWKDLFIICNRDRADGGPPLLVERFDPAKLNEEVIMLLSATRAKSEEEYIEVVFKKIPEILDIKRRKDNEQKTIEKLVNLPNQIVGNCTWAATEGILKTYLLIKELQKPSPNIKSVETRFLSWQLFQQMELLGKYLKGPVDTSVVYQSFNILWIAKKRFPKVFDTKLSERLEMLEEQYKMGKSSAELRTFRINKASSKVISSRIPLRRLQGIISALALFFTTGRIKPEKAK